MYLNDVRANLTACCEYPALVLWQWQYDYCTDTCMQDSLSRDRCCILVCCLNLLTILGSTTEKTEVKQEGLVYSFLLSVGNDTAWRPVVENSVSRCHTQLSEKENAYDCEVIPKNLYLMVDCAYLENYLKCSKWNPYSYEECPYTHEYVTKCTN
jgi:hypothetical protein